MGRAVTEVRGGGGGRCVYVMTNRLILVFSHCSRWSRIGAKQTKDYRRDKDQCDWLWENYINLFKSSES